MPRYFFNVHDGADMPDNEGIELAGIEEAQQAAVRYAGSVIADTAKTTKLGEDWSMDVTDGTGLVLFRLDFLVSATAATSGRAAKDRR